MKGFYKNHRKALLIIGLLLMAAVLVWAAAELSGQANSMAQDAGSNSADMEMVTLNTIKKPEKTKDSPKPPPCDWKKERSIKKQIDANDRKYKSLRSKAKSELKGTGKVSSGTKNAVMASAGEFKKLCDQYAAMWDACKCRTRAKTARKTGETRLKSAAVLVGGDIDEAKLKDMQDSQDEMKVARREYVVKATEGDEISDADKGDLQSNVVPQIKGLITDSQALVTNVTSLLGDIQDQATGGGISSLTKMASGGGASAVSSLLSPVKTLMSVAKGMLTNVQALLSDAQSLIAGSLTGATSSLTSGGGKISPCFIGAAEE